MVTESQQLTNDSSFFLDDGNIIFRVENTLFNVHRYFFICDSPIFRDMLSLPPGEGPIEGTSISSPIVLEQVKAPDFTLLLWMFYNPTFTNYSATVESWCAILALADKWQMDTIREVAFQELGKLPMDPMDKIVLCERYQMSREWAFNAFISVCTKEEPLTFEEAGKISNHLLALVAAARERVILHRYKRYGKKIPSPQSVCWSEDYTPFPEYVVDPLAEIVRNTILSA